MSEAQRARLHRLADSINDTALTARKSLSITLVVALYLVLTLVFSTDEDLLLNAQVTLPEVGIDISVAQSYLFAPPIFFSLHIPLLFLLSVLARKVRTFETALKEEFPDALLPRLQNKVEVKREECWEWLSAFAFAQLFRQTPGGGPALRVTARTLGWFGIEAVPLALLFVIDVSFVRYQSDWITWSHHCIFILDSVSIGIFNWFVLPGRDRRQWKNSHRSSSSLLDRWISGMVGMLGRLWTLVRLIVALCMALLLICYARPPHFDPQSVEDDRRSIWQEDDREFWQAVLEDGENPLDAGPCRWWGFGCRYLDVRNKQLLSAQTVEDIQSFGLGSPDLAGRRLRFARFGSVYLPGADLHQTELQGADLAEAELQGANLVGAELHGVRLVRAKLQGAALRGAELQGANFTRAELQGANLQETELQGANLREAELQGSKGKPDRDSWRLTWMPCVSFGPFDPSEYLEEFLSDEIKDIKLAWRNSTLEEYMKQPLSGSGSDGKIFDGAKPEEKDMVFHTLKDPNWPNAPDVNSDNRYWDAWAEWTADFACKNEYTARSSLQRWTSRRRGPGVPRFRPNSRLLPTPPECAQKKIRDAILKASKRKREECPGLHALTADKWEEFGGGQPWPRRTGPVCTS